MAIFCMTCPRPGFNLQDNWKEDKERFGDCSVKILSMLIQLVFRRWMYMATIMQDGNFSAEHLKLEGPMMMFHSMRNLDSWSQMVLTRHIWLKLWKPNRQAHAIADISDNHRFPNHISLSAIILQLSPSGQPG